MAKFTMNVFQIAVIACAMLFGMTSAQTGQSMPLAVQNQGGHMRQPVPLQGDRDVVGYTSNVDGCGLKPEENYLYQQNANNPSLTITPGQTVTISYVANGPLGFGPLYVRFDGAGLGQKYDTMAQVSQNLPGTNGYYANSPTGSSAYYTNIQFVVPQNIQCPNRGVCLMQVLNQQAYVSCAYVRLSTSNTPMPVDPSGGVASLYGGHLAQAKLERLEALVDILKNLGVDARVIFQSNFDVNDLIRRLISIIN